MFEQPKHVRISFIEKALRDLTEAIESIEAIRAGKPPPDGRTPDQAIRELECIISMYDTLIRTDSELSQGLPPGAGPMSPL